MEQPLYSKEPEGSDIGVLGGLQRSHSDHRQQHITPILKIKTFYQGSGSERIFLISCVLVGEIWYKLKMHVI